MGEPAKINVDQRLYAVPAGTGQPVLPGNLPVRLSSFVGRLTELGEVDRLLARSRMVTLTGVGGCGKSRLALEAATEVAESYEDGVWWVDLAALGDPALLPATVASTLSIRERPGADLTGAIRDRLRGASLLLVFDNCEHLVRECGALAEGLLRGCPAVSVLATSREPLAVEGETTYTVPSLALPDGGDVEALSEVESVRLFVERTRQVNADFRLTATNAEPVAEICRRLDGIPLAIELAAARSRLLSPAQILEGLTDRFGLLTGGRRTALPRHRTLQASVDWSYTLLAAGERELLHRLSVFAGSFGLDAMRDVCCIGSIDRDDALELLAHLVDKSLVAVQDGSDGARYRLLETIRQYAADKLAATGDAPAIRDRHLDYYVRLAEEAEGPLEGPDQGPWLDRLDLELPNLRAAGEWAMASGQVEQDVRLAAALWFFFVCHSYLSDWAVRVADRMPPPDLDPLLRARFLQAAGWYYFFTGELSRSFLPEEALRIGRELGDPYVIGRAQMGLAFIDILTGQPTAAPRFEEAITAFRETGDSMFLGLATSGLGWAHITRGHADEGRRLVADGLRLSRESGNRWVISDALLFAGWFHWFAGDFARAEEMLREGIAISRDLGDTFLLSNQLGILGTTLLAIGKLDAADEALRESVRLAREMGNGVALAWALADMGLLALYRGDVEGALPVLEEAFALSGSVGNRLAAGQALIFSGYAQLARGDVEKTAALMARGEELAREISSPWSLTAALQGQAMLARKTDDLGRAESLVHEALRVAMAAELLPEVVESLDSLAGLLAATGRHVDSARVFAAADAQRRTMGCIRPSLLELMYADDLASVQEALGEPAYESARADGAAMSLAEVVAYVTRGRGTRARPASGWESLTPVELNVVRLVAQGLSNPQIAEQLFISPRTVQSHLRRIYARLDLPNRAALTAEATRHTD